MKKKKKKFKVEGQYEVQVAGTPKKAVPKSIPARECVENKGILLVRYLQLSAASHVVDRQGSASYHFLHFGLEKKAELWYP